MPQRTHRAAVHVVLPLLAVVAALCALVVPSRAEAEEFGRQSVLALSADQLFGIVFGELDFDRARPLPDNEIEFTIAGLGMTTDVTPLWSPRFAIDGFVIDGLSVGGSLGFVFIDDDDVDGRDDDGTIFLIAPRVGYAYMFADWVGIWGRGGFTFYTSDEAWFEQNQFALDLEAIFVFAIAESFGLTLGPVARIGLTGDHNDDDDFDYQEWGIGINFGLLGWLGV